jgi:hypothetical protein
MAMAMAGARTQANELALDKLRDQLSIERNVLFIFMMVIVSW